MPFFFPSVNLKFHSLLQKQGQESLPVFFFGAFKDSERQLLRWFRLNKERDSKCFLLCWHARLSACSHRVNKIKFIKSIIASTKFSLSSESRDKSRQNLLLTLWEDQISLKIKLSAAFHSQALDDKASYPSCLQRMIHRNGWNFNLVTHFTCHEKLNHLDRETTYKRCD